MSEGAYAHRILSRILGRSVAGGETVRIEPDRALLSGARCPTTLVRLRAEGRPAHPERMVVTMDFYAPEVESKVPRSRALCREIAEEYELPHLLDVNLGIGSQVAVESSLIHPGELVIGCGRCLGVTGGVGAMPIRLDEAALVEALARGFFSYVVPRTARVDLVGKPPRHAGPLDLAFAVAEALGPALQGRVVELHGGAREWSVDLRMGVTGLLLEMGAASALAPPSAPVVRFFKERGVTVEEVETGVSGYDTSVSIDVRRVGARFARRYEGPADDLSGKDGEAIQGVFIGSCYGGRFEDMALAAEVLKREKRVHPHVRLALSPATLETARACLAAGYFETFLSAGAMVVVPGAGPGSAGGGAMFGEGERIVSTAEYHRLLSPGQGVPDVVLSSPAAAAVAAVHGRLIDPAPYLA